MGKQRKARKKVNYKKHKIKSRYTDKKGFLGKISEKLKEIDAMLQKHEVLVKRITFFIIPIIILMFVHFLEFGLFERAVLWPFHDFGSFLLSYIVVLMAIMVIYCATNSAFAGVLTVTIFTFLLSFVSSAKLFALNEVLMFLDFNFINDVGDFAGFMSEGILEFPVILRIGVIIFIVGFLIGQRKKFVHKLKVPTRVLGIVLIPLAFYSLFFTSFSQAHVLDKFGINFDLRSSVNSIHREKGILLGIYMDAIMNKVEIPENYTKERIFEILAKIDNKQEVVQENEVEESVVNEGVSEDSAKVKPNVVVVMSEAFMDITKLPNLELSADPIPNIRKLMENYTSGTMISSSYGKATANIEFELFTGNSPKFLTYGSVPYRDEKEIFDGDIFAMPKEFKEEGYETVALHTYKSSFYSRNKNYPKLGFDEFYGINELNEIEKVVYDGKYVADIYLMDRVIDELKEEGDSPKFIFALSMQNHYPYDATLYNHDVPVEVSSKYLKDEQLNEVKAYVHGLYDTDISIKKLINYIESSNEPTIVLFYGDHWPCLSSVWNQLKFVKSTDEQTWSGEELYKTREIPFFIYDNYTNRESYEKIDAIGIQKLGSYLYDYVGIDKSLYFKFIDTLDFKAMYDRVFVDSKGDVHLKATPEYEEQIDEYELLQYDILYGEQYIKEYIKNSQESNLSE